MATIHTASRKKGGNEMAEDAKKPYGDVEYADPGYQKDKQKRYPIDTEAHARAAWSYINQADNAAKYSSADLSKVKARIRAACKKFGITLSDDSEDTGEGPEGKKKDKEDVGESAEAKQGPIECRAAVQISPISENEILFLPTGVHAITPVRGGIGKPIKVLVNSDSAHAVEEQRAEITARTGKKVYFDFNHEDGPASFWPQAFLWRQGEGVIARGDWSASGKKAVEGKDYRAFSPVFHVDDKHKDPARVVCCDGARPNMGGLVNDPAFSALPLWAKNAGENGDNADNNKEKKKMAEEDNTNEIATLRAKNTELAAELEKLRAIAAKDSEDEAAKDKVERVEATFRANQFELEAAELRAENKRQREEITKRNRITAKAAVKQAVMDGKIAPKDFRTQERWENEATADPSFIRNVIDATIAHRPGRIIDPIKARDGNGSVSITGEDPAGIFAKMSNLLRQSA